jgi:hypothetical protein
VGLLTLKPLTAVAVPEILNLTEATTKNLNVTYLSTSEQKLPKLEFSNITSFTATEMTIQLKFDRPALVSTEPILDRIRISIDSDFFARVNQTLPKPQESERTSKVFQVME